MRERIRLVRKEAGLTQQEFSVKLGYAPTSAASWEKTDAQEPPEPVKLLICKMFNINEHWLRTGEGPMRVETPASMLDRLMVEKNMGPGGRLLMKAILRVYEELGEEKCIEVIDSLFPDIQQAMQQRMSEKFSAGAAAPENEQARSASE